MSSSSRLIDHPYNVFPFNDDAYLRSLRELTRFRGGFVDWIMPEMNRPGTWLIWLRESTRRSMNYGTRMQRLRVVSAKPQGPH